jgi:hypothetical protein
MAEPKGVHLPEILFELRRVGRSVRVAAIDPVTATEVVMVGPAGHGTETLKRLAARKLAYVLAKKRTARRRRRR